MQVQIPIELVPWIRMSPRGLVPRDNMPDEIVPLFKELTYSHSSRSGILPAAL